MDLEMVVEIAAILSGLGGLAVAVFTYRHQVRLERSTAEALEKAEQRLQPANLDLELRLEGTSSVMLVVRNLGPHAARNVEIEGRLDRGGYQRLRSWPSMAPGSEQALIVPQPGYRIMAGNTHFDTLVSWEDGVGEHQQRPFVATRRTPDR